MATPRRSENNSEISLILQHHFDAEDLKTEGTMAESGGSDTAEVLSTSDIYYDFFCQYCSSDDKHLEAQGYCKDCDEYLCGECCNHHNKISITRHHTVIGKDEMPKTTKPESATDVCIDICSKHRGKIVEYYCSDHKELGCSVCVTLTHKECKVEYIPEVAKDNETTSAFNKFERKLISMADGAESLLAAVKGNIDRCEKFSERAIHTWKEFRQKIIDALDRAEAELEAEIEKKKTGDTDKMNSINIKSKEILKDVQTTLDKFQKLKKNRMNCQIFTFVKSESHDVDRQQVSLDKSSSEAKIQHYTFSPDDDVLQKINGVQCLGSFSIRDPKQLVKAEHVGDITVRSDTDTDTCWISGCVLLSDNRLVCVDAQNQKVKLVNIMDGKVVDEIKVPSSPYDVTLINGHEIGVSSYNATKMYVISVEHGLVLNKEITVMSKHRGVCFNNGRFITVVDDKIALEKINIDGETLMSIDLKSEGDGVVQNSYYCTIAPNGQFIYLTDFKENSVTRLSLDGEIKKKIINQELKGLLGIAVDPLGALFVVSSSKYSVKMLTTDLEYIGTILTMTNESFPKSICYDENDDRLYIGCKSDVIKVYQIKRG